MSIAYPTIRHSRYLAASIKADALAAHKMAFISGPRQVGKTTLGRELLLSPENEFSWDVSRFRRQTMTASFQPKKFGC